MQIILFVLFTSFIRSLHLAFGKLNKNLGPFFSQLDGLKWISGSLHFPVPGPLPDPWPWPPTLVPNLYLLAMAPNLYLPVLAPNLYLPTLVPTLYLPTLANNFITSPGPDFAYTDSTNR